MVKVLEKAPILQPVGGLINSGPSAILFVIAALLMAGYALERHGIVWEVPIVHFCPWLTDPTN